MKTSAFTLATVLAATSSTHAFTTPNTAIVSTPQQCSSVLFMSETESVESAFVADADAPAGEEDSTFDAVEKMGRGAAKVR